MERFATPFEERVSELIRTAEISDLESIVAIEEQVSNSPWARDQFVASCDNSIAGAEAALVSEVAGEINGFIVYSSVLDVGEVLNIAVAPLAQCRGIGRALMNSAVAEMSAAGLSRVLLEVRASNLPALELYRSQGFERDGVRKNYYRVAQGREDAVLMSLNIAGANAR